MSFFERLSKSHKSLAVWSLLVSIGGNLGWPLVEAASQGMLGEDVKPYALSLVALAGIFGWAIPQKSISGKAGK